MAYLDNVKVFIRVFERGSLSAAGRDLRVSPAVASNRIKELEKHLGVRLFNRTTRTLTATEHGRVFYEGAKKILEAVEEAEAAIADISKNPKGTIHVTAPLGIGKRIIAPLIPLFNDLYPDIAVRLRLSDRTIDILSEGVDVAFKLGVMEDSNLRMRGIVDCDRVLCASPDYLEKHGRPATVEALRSDHHHCLVLRFPGVKEFAWTLQTPDGPRKVEISGPFESDDGDVLTDWALAGRGIILKPRFEVARHLRNGSLVTVLDETPPAEATLACLYPHKRFQDPKVRLFIEFMVVHCRKKVQEMTTGG